MTLQANSTHANIAVTVSTSPVLWLWLSAGLIEIYSETNRNILERRNTMLKAFPIRGVACHCMNTYCAVCVLMCHMLLHRRLD